MSAAAVWSFMWLRDICVRVSYCGFANQKAFFVVMGLCVRDFDVMGLLFCVILGFYSVVYWVLG